MIQQWTFSKSNLSRLLVALIVFLSSMAAQGADWQQDFLKAESIFNGRTQEDCIPLFENLVSQIMEESKRRVLTSAEMTMVTRSLDYLGQAYFNMNQQENARKAFINLLSFDPEHKINEDLVSSKIVNFFAQLKKENAERIATLNPQRALILETGVEHLRRLDAAAASESFQRLVTENPSDAEARSALSEALLVLGFDKRAAQESARALQQSASADPAARGLIEARAMEATGKCKEAAQQYGNLSPDSDNTIRQARSKLKCGEARGALEMIRAAEYSAGSNVDPRLALMEAQALLDLADYPPARDAAIKSSSQVPQDAQTFLLHASILQAEALLRSGDGAGARSLFSKALEGTGVSQDSLIPALAHLGLGEFYEAQKETASAEREFQAARKILEEIGNERELPRALLGLGNAALLQNDALAARAQFSTALQLPNVPSQLQPGLKLGLGKALLKLNENGVPQLEEALQLARQRQDRNIVAAASLAIASAPGVADAEAKYREAMQLFREMGDARSEAEAQLGLAAALQKKGDTSGAIQLYEASLQQARQSGDQLATAQLLQSLADLLVAADRKMEAAGYVRESAKIYQELGKTDEAASAREDFNLLTLDYRNQVVLLLQKGFQALNAGNYRESVSAYEEAIELAKQIDDLSSQANALNSLGFVYSQQKDDEAAKERWQSALELSRKASDRKAEALSLFNLATAEHNLGNHSLANSLFDQSVAISKEIGEKPRTKPW